MISKLQKFQSRGLHAVIHQIITEQMQTFLPSLIQPAKFKSLMRERLLSQVHTACQRDSTHRMESPHHEQTFRNVLEPEEVMGWNIPLE